MKDAAIFNRPTAEVLCLDTETQFVPSGVVSRTLLATESTRITLFTFDDRQELSEHSTPRRAVVHIVAGQCQFTVGGKRYDLKTGDLLSLPPGAPHAVRAVGQFSMLLTLCAPEPPMP